MFRSIKERGKQFIVTMDGPAASGKSTTARLVAKRLGWLYLDTGAMYRALTVKVLQKNVLLEDIEKIGKMTENTEIKLIPSDERVRVFLDGKEVTADIRHPDVDKSVGPVCEISRVRQIMVSMQRNSAEGKRVIAEGRDMGTVVFPEAEIKFYIFASLEERAKRRQIDMAKQGIEISVKSLMNEIEKRDHRDSTRQNSPLMQADDAILIDTTNMDVEEQVSFVIDRIVQQMEYRGNNA